MTLLISHSVVRELVTYESAAIHDTSDKNHTPLHCAALWGHFGIVQYLVENGAHLDAVYVTIHKFSDARKIAVISKAVVGVRPLFWPKMVLA